MVKNFKKIRNRPKKTAVRKGMHYLLDFLTEVETKIDWSERVEIDGSLEGWEDLKKVSILDFWESLKKFLGQFSEASGIPLKDNDLSISIDLDGKGHTQSELAVIYIGDVQLRLEFDDLYRYYGMMKFLRRGQYTGNIFHFFFLGEERTVTSKITIGDIRNVEAGELESTLDGRILGEKLFVNNAISAIKDDFKITKSGSYELESNQKQVYLLKGYIGQEKGTQHLFSLPPALSRINETKMEFEKGHLIHHAEFRVPGINYSNWLQNDGSHTLNEVIRSFIVQYGIAYGGFDAITKCHVCGKTILPKKKSHRSFCSKKCRSINHRIEFGKDEFACFERQKQWFSYQRSLLSNTDAYATIDTDNCKGCERYWRFEKIPGGMCDVFNYAYQMTNINKGNWIKDQKVKLVQKIAEENKAFQEEFEKLSNQKPEKK